MEYTKGEWVADNGDSELWGIFQEEDCDGIAYLCESNGKLLRLEQAEANAHLIAAAPDMYEELLEADRVICELCYRLNPQHATADNGIGCKSCEDRECRLKALAKAKGK